MDNLTARSSSVVCHASSLRSTLPHRHLQHLPHRCPASGFWEVVLSFVSGWVLFHPPIHRVSSPSVVCLVSSLVRRQTSLQRRQREPTKKLGLVSYSCYLWGDHDLVSREFDFRRSLRRLLPRLHRDLVGFPRARPRTEEKLTFEVISPGYGRIRKSQEGRTGA